MYLLTDVGRTYERVDGVCVFVDEALSPGGGARVSSARRKLDQLFLLRRNNACAPFHLTCYRTSLPFLARFSPNRSFLLWRMLLCVDGLFRPAGPQRLRAGRHRQRDHLLFLPHHTGLSGLPPGTVSTPPTTANASPQAALPLCSGVNPSRLSSVTRGRTPAASRDGLVG